MTENTIMQKALQKTVGVLGGLGPEATLDFFSKVLVKSAAGSDQEHLHLLIDNNPQVPNRNEAIAGRGPSPGPMLAGMAQGLELAGAEFLVMVCNAAHAFQSDIEAASSLPLVSIIEETVQETLHQRPWVKTVGVLGSSGCLDANLYQHAFAKKGIEVVIPEDAARAAFMTLLYGIKAGNKGKPIRREMRDLAQELIQQGAEVIIAGCTEVPLVLQASDLPCPLINSTDVLVNATIAYARGERALPGVL